MRIAALQGPLELGIDYRRFVPASKTDQARPPFFNPAKPHNVGDWFLTKIVDRTLDYEELLLVQRNAGRRDWDLVNEQCDALVLRGGNYIQSRWFSTHVGLETLEKVKIPIVLFGAGLQTPPGQRPYFEPEELRALKLIAGSCACLAVRGPSTAEALSAAGIDNVVLTGCPTVFWDRRPQLALKAPGYSRTGFTFRKTLYTSKGEMTRAQFRALDALRRRSQHTTVFLQGEEVALQRHLQATRWGAEFEGQMLQVEGHRLLRLERRPLDPESTLEEVHELFDRHAEPELVDWLAANAFFSWDIEEMIAAYRSMDLIVGCRLHGNLLALANGTPAYYLTYDERTREVVELLHLPSSPVDRLDPDLDFAAQDWRPVQGRYQECYRRMLEFLEGNRLAHRLPAPLPALAGSA